MTVGGASESQWSKTHFCELLQNLNYKNKLYDIYAWKYKLNAVTVQLTLPSKVSEEESTLMAANLQKYNYEARPNTRLQTSSAKSPDKSGLTPPVAGVSTSMDTATIKADIFSSLRKEISSVIREELKSALVKDFESLKKEIIDVKTEIANNTAVLPLGWAICLGIYWQNLVWWTFGETNTLKAKTLPFFCIDIPHTPE